MGRGDDTGSREVIVADNELAIILRALLPNLPMVGAYAVGVIFAVLNWRRAPRAAALVLLAVCLMAFNLVASALVYSWLPNHLLQNGWTADRLTTVFSVVRF